ncbi:hypothetical protein FM036_35060 [Nostoc sp. HG1]|nr:hypothetical protein [Nostoc sp. HG1]
MHWVKDVVLQEDGSRIYDRLATTNLSVTRAMAMNILRQQGYRSLMAARRLLGNHLQKIILFLQ